MTALQPDALISDLIDHLDNAEKYLIDVVKNMVTVEVYSPTVRIGVSGTGARPYHSITYNGINGQPAYLSCDGQKTDTNWSIHPNSPEWSSRSMTIAEVRATLQAVWSKSEKKAL